MKEGVLRGPFGDFFTRQAVDGGHNDSDSNANPETGSKGTYGDEERTQSFTDKQKLRHIDRLATIKAKGGSLMDYYEKHGIASAQVSNWMKSLGKTKVPTRSKKATPRPSFTASIAATDLASTVEALETENEAYRMALVQVQTELRQALGR